MSSKPSTVNVVHCIDTEGPLHEPVTATFERLTDIFGLDLEPSADLLEKLQQGKVELGGIEDAVRKVVDPHLISYNDTWDKIDTMLRRIMAQDFRGQLPDSFDGGWLYSWFCVDHVAYAENPRRRDIGYGNILAHYRQVLRETNSAQDELFFHFHPHNYRHEAHRCATHWWANSDTLFQIICRRIIDYAWFPVANRPGFHVTRPDSHWFLEQFVPFDYANQAMASSDNDQPDVQGGRFGDWRRAPANWQPYQPAADDYQVPGDCRRWIARCLNVGTRFGLITQSDVDQAFEEARHGRPVVLSVTNHDFRDMGPDIELVMKYLADAQQRYPDVPFRYATAVDAMRAALELPVQRPCELEIEMTTLDTGVRVMAVNSTTPTFGPQPWLAIKTRTGEYLHDNFDIDTPFHAWHYVFDETTVPFDALQTVGIATNNAFGVTTVAHLDADTLQVSRHVSHERTGRAG